MTVIEKKDSGVIERKKAKEKKRNIGKAEKAEKKKKAIMKKEGNGKNRITFSASKKK